LPVPAIVVHDIGSKGIFIMTSDPSPNRDRLPNGKWPSGVSGNPKGRPPKKPSIDLDKPSALEQALNKKAKVKYGEKMRTLTKRDAIIEQMVNQAAQGDYRARRDLFAYGEKHGVDIFAGRHKAIQKRVAEAAVSSSGITLPDEVLDRLPESTLNEIIKAVNKFEAEKKKTMH
jgi:hypothetical protein